MYELVMLMCIWSDGSSLSAAPEYKLVCSERILVTTKEAYKCREYGDSTRSDGRNVTIYCRPKAVKLEK